MMASRYLEEEGEEKDQFFDSREELSSVSDSSPGSPNSSHPSFTEENSVNWVTYDPFYKVWIRSPGSIQERRAKFMQSLGLEPVGSLDNNSIVLDRQRASDDTIEKDFDRTSSGCGTVLRGSGLENRSILSRCFDDNTSTSSSLGRTFYECGTEILDQDREFVARESNQNGAQSSLQEDDRHFVSSYLQKPLTRDGSSSSSNSDKAPRRKGIGWLRKLGTVACIAGREGFDFDSGFRDSEQSKKVRFQRIQVRPYRKKSKEFSAVYLGQDFKAHHGAILAMKFSPCGEYLASGGEDGVVRVWQVMECASSSEDGIPHDDPCCIYFSVNQKAKLSPLHPFKEKRIKSKSLHRTSDSACVVIPQEVFHISEKPLYEFHGHHGNVLDLAWSNDKCLLSSSVDKTVLLWKLGSDGCLKVFAHNNYVTCIQFNPMDEKYFVSGSIDGKVRIWEIPTCRVVSWAGIKDLVSAVCYRPDGKGVIVGSMMGDCCFYDASDNHLELETKVSFEGKKKSLDKRITGFQFYPGSSRKLMVTSADSVIRTLDGIDVVSKYKGLRNAGSQISATFTSDGRHIVSASEDSNIYIWNHSNKDHNSTNSKSIRSSERFASSNACIAIPWQGLSSKMPSLAASVLLLSHEGLTGLAETDFKCHVYSLRNNALYLSPSGSLTFSHEFFADTIPRSSATWPEEKLPSGMMRNSSFGKSQLKLLRPSYQRSTSHAWAQVIVTAGWDGRIRSFQNFGLPVHL